MGLFDFMKGKGNTETPEPVTYPVILGAAAKGKFVPMAEIPDEVFSAGILGACCGIDPDEGKIYAPVSGKICQLADTLHAIGIEAADMELLIHVGVDTVEMKGDGFQAMVKEGQTVKKGDLLLTIDLDKIYKAGHPATVILAVTNTDHFSAIESIGVDQVNVGDGVLRITGIKMP